MKVTFGVDYLDEELDGGFQRGSVVLVEGHPDSPVRTFIQRIMDDNEGAYVTTKAPETTIKKAIDANRIEFHNQENSILDKIVSDFEVVIVDSLGFIDDDLDTYGEFLRDAAEHADENDTTIVFRLDEEESTPGLRHYARATADSNIVVLDTPDEDSTEQKLNIRKVNGEEWSVTKPLKIARGEVKMDTSRQIS